ncbi:MAG: DUF2252 family protein, partial [Alphaproteobacteria bacterium]|nr:DUF2252 family protein [Alphaproteobacteria bacterium]
MVEHSPGAVPPQTHIRPIKERVQLGRALREHLPRRHHAGWKAPANRRDPIDILIEQGKARLPELLPERYARMKATPFTFLRGAAAVMAADLEHEASAGIAVQACGDCHLLNFGAFASPEENILFDINDFDETLPGVDFSVDLKRLAASVAVAALAARLSKRRARSLAASTAKAYRVHIGRLTTLTPLEIWHSKIDLNQEISRIDSPALRRRLAATISKARRHIEQDDNFPHLVKGGRIA